MATVKITKSMRESIVRKLLVHSFESKVNALVVKKREFAATIYQHCFTAEDHKLLKELKEGWLPTCDSIKVKLGSDVDELDFSGWFSFSEEAYNLREVTKSPEDIYRPFPASKKGAVVKAFDAKDKLVDLYRDLRDQAASLDEAIGVARAKARSALDRFSTIGGLIKEWPEIEPFARHYIISSTPTLVNLPAIRVEELNSLLDLPVKEQAACA